MKSHNDFQHTLLMLLFCLLPVFIFFLLIASGVSLSPMLFFLFIAICCIAMFYFMRQTHPAHSSEMSAHMEIQNNAEKIKQVIPMPENLGDVFQANHVERIDDTLIFEGNLLTEPDAAYQKLKEESDKKNISTLLQEDNSGRTLIIVSGKKEDFSAVKPSKAAINLILFILTILTTTFAGALQQGINILKEPDKFGIGLPYAIALIAILGAHELGHYFTARKYNMNVTLPYFIPVPFALGTFGAFIQLKSHSENRKVLFDVGIAGPIAGLILAIPALIIGLQTSKIIPITNQSVMSSGADIGSSILLTILAKLSIGGELAAGHTLQFSPLAFAGWLGLLVTALNLIPIGQLDGGHMAHALFGRKNANTIGTVALFSLFLLGLFVWSGLLTWAIIVFFLAGIKSPPPLNDVTKLDRKRVILGLVAYILLFLILIPFPHTFYQSLGINCPYA